MQIVLGIAWFIVLGFMPGYVLVSIFRLKNISWVKGLLYIVGISLVFDMCVGFAVNLIYPRIGLVPFDQNTMTGTWLSIMLIFIVVMIAMGDRLVNPYKWDNQWITVLLIYVGGVLLIYQTSLLTNNLVGSDIHLEYYYANQPVLKGYSDVNTFAYINICLPITILIPMYVTLTGMEVMTVFKWVQPLVLALLPVILYKIFKLQFGEFVAILSVIFFVTLPFFTMDIVQLVRQQYAMIFFGLTTLVLTGRDTNMFTKIVLSTVFGLGVVISHYGVGVGFLWYMAIGFIVLCGLKLPLAQRMWARITKQEVPLDIKYKPWRSVIVWMVVGVVCVGGGLVYYKYVGSGVGMSNAVKSSMAIVMKTTDSIVVVKQGEKPVTKPSTPTEKPVEKPVEEKRWELPQLEFSTKWLDTIVNYFREPLLRTAIGLDFNEASTLGKVWRILLFVVEFCILLGITRLFVRPMPRIRAEFLALIITSGFVVIGLYTLPTNGFGMGAVRVIIVTLMFLSPFFVLGLEWITQLVVKLTGKVWQRKYMVAPLVVVLLPYILFNSGVVFEIAKSDRIDTIDIPFAPALSAYRLDMTAYYADEDIVAMEWVQDKISKEYPLYADWHGYQLVWQYVGEYNSTKGIESFCDKGQGYVFLRKWNVDNEKLTYGTVYGCRQSVPWLEYNMDLLYNRHVSDCASPMSLILSKGEVVYDKGAKIIKVTK